MATEACCTCAALLSSIPPLYNEKTEKAPQHERRLECCGRAICARCVTDNPRFSAYCPYCQISVQPSVLPQGLRDPPPYSPPEDIQSARPTQDNNEYDNPPAYSEHMPRPIESKESSGSGDKAPDVLHFLNPEEDSIQSLALRYGVPAVALRKANGLYSDHLLAARRTLLIPGEFYKGGVSLSPRPVEGEEEEARKNKVRRWMVACKVAEYDIATLYLKQSDYDLDAAIEAFKADESWEEQHPLEAAKRGKKPVSSRIRKPFGSRPDWL